MTSRPEALVCLAVALALGGCNPFSFPEVEPTLTALEITAPAAFPAGAGRQLVATGQFDDGVRRDVTGAVRWTSLDPDVATVSDGGAVRGVAPGSVSITATDPATSIMGNTTVTVSAAALVSIAVTPPAPSIPLGATAQFTATGTYADGTTEDLTESVTWSSSVAAVAAFSYAAGASGLASTGTAGTAVVTATSASSSVSGSATLTVTSAQLVALAVTPSAPSVPVGVPRQFTATGTYTNGTTEDLTSVVTWSSADEAVATISGAAAPRGVATGVSPGGTTIRASDPATHVSGSTTLTVTPARLVSIAVTPAAASVPLGLGRQLAATGTYTNGTTQDLTAAVHWSSSSLAGSTTLTVSAAELVSIEVTPAAAAIPLGRTEAFTATGRYTDGTLQDVTAAVTWSSSAPAIASVSNATGSRGVATSASAGATTIRATHAATGIAAAGTLTVTSAELVSLAVTPAAATVTVGETAQFTASGTFSDGSQQDLTGSVTWTSSDRAVAEVSNAAGSNGLASGLAAGSATVEGRDPATGSAATASLLVVPAATSPGESISSTGAAAAPEPPPYP
jgi:uncharacterized protein YjdB